MNDRPKNPEITLQTKQPQKVKAAIDSWVKESEKTDSDPLGLDEAPEWVTNAFAEAVKITLPGNRLPTSGEWDMELLGELLGRQQALAKLYSGEMPMGPEMTAECERLEEFAASLPQSPDNEAKVNAMVQDMETMMGATHAAIPPLLASVMDSSHEDALKFQKGLGPYPASQPLRTYPERFAQQALGHNSKAVHHAYSKHAEVTVPSLDDWEKDWEQNPQRGVQPKLLPVDFRPLLATHAQVN